MTRIAELLLNGISLGSLYALIALGFVIVFKATRVVNFAQASFLLFGVWVVALAQPHVGFAAAALLGLGGCGLLGLVVERLLLARIDRHRHDALSILMLAVNIVLIAELTRRLEERVLPLGAPWDGKVVHLGAVVVPLSALVTIAAALLLIGGLIAVLKLTGAGLAMRASIESPEAAALVGIRLHRVSMSAWVLAGALATVAGIGLASFPSPGVSVAIELAAVKALPAAIVGGLDSLGGAIAGGLIIGTAEVFVAGYADELSFLGQGPGDVMAYLIMIIVLLWRPSGLFGAKEVIRV